MLKATIDRSGCIGCGLCSGTCPEVFRMADDGLAEVYADPSAEQEEAVKTAEANCPVSVISVSGD